MVTGITFPFVSFQVTFTSLERQNTLGNNEAENLSLHALVWLLPLVFFAEVPLGIFPLQVLAMLNKHLRHIIP